jgi:hypothetical protein
MRHANNISFICVTQVPWVDGRRWDLLPCDAITDVEKQITLQKQLSEERKKANHTKYFQFTKLPDGLNKALKPPPK